MPIDALDREWARRSFHNFLPLISPTFDWTPPHLKKIAGVLDSISLESPKNVILQVPVRHGKTEISTLRYPLYRLHKTPGLRIVAAGYNQDFANKFGRRSRRLAEDFGIPLSSDRAAVSEWETAQGGSYFSVGVGGGVTGNGFDLLMVDDPVKSREEAESEVYREKVWDWFTSDLWTRREPGASVVVTMSRWHEDDLSGRIQNSEFAHEWEVIHIPALAEPGDVLGRAPGEALWPERFTAGELRRIEAFIGDYPFSGLYQQRPTPLEGGLFKAGLIQKVAVDQVPEGLNECRGWDLSASLNGDFSAGVKISGPCRDGFFYITHAHRGQWEPAERNQNIRSFADQDGKHTIIRVPQDPGAGGKEAAQNIVRLLVGYIVIVKPFGSAGNVGNKVNRAEPFASAVNNGLVRMVKSNWNDHFVNELVRFPNGRNDDYVDAASDAFNELASRAPKWHEEERLPEKYSEEWIRVMRQQ
jgi:predicted phage terminase large subunit-like protein